MIASGLPPLRLTVAERMELRRRKMNRTAKALRDRNRSAGLCINGADHGSATSGKLCDHCRDVHNHGAS